MQIINHYEDENGSQKSLIKANVTESITKTTLNILDEKRIQFI